MQTLHEAAAEGDEQRVAKLLASAPSDVDLDASDSDGLTALMHACRQGHAAVVKELLKAGASVSQGTAELSPLLCAAEGGRKEVIRLLLDHGAELEERNVHGVNALIRAASRGNVDAAHYLLLRGANVHTTNKFGLTPLMVAAMKDSLNHVAVLEVLLRGGARTEDRSPEGLTALMYAAELGSVQGMDRLMRYDADPLASGRDSRMVVDYASTEEKQELLLRKASAAPEPEPQPVSSSGRSFGYAAIGATSTTSTSIVSSGGGTFGRDGGGGKYRQIVRSNGRPVGLKGITGQSEQVGGATGHPFTVSILCLPGSMEGRTHITRVDVWCGPLDYVDSGQEHHFPVTVYWMELTVSGVRGTVRVGGEGPAEHMESWSAAWDEFLTGLIVTLDTLGDLTLVSGIALLTSRGRTYSFGARDGYSRRLEAPPGGMVTGFIGRKGWVVDAIGIQWGPIPSPLPMAIDDPIHYDPLPADMNFLIKTAQASDSCVPLAHVLHTVQPFGKGSFGTVHACTLELVPTPSQGYTKLQALLAGQPQLCLKLLELTLTVLPRDEVIKEYTRETALHASLQHPNLTRFLGRLPPQRLGDREVCGYVMERADCTLTEYIQRLHQDSAMSSEQRWQALRTVAVGIASGLQALHAHPLSIVHRDLHEDNILVLNGRAIIADLGRGRALDAPRSKHLTEAPGWTVIVPPEAWGREEGSEVEYDQSYDIYGLGLILLKLCISATMTKNEYDKEKRYMELGPGSEARIPTWKMWLRDRAEASCRSLQEPTYLYVASQCISDSPTDRPTISHVVTQLRDLAAQV